MKKRLLVLFAFLVIVAVCAGYCGFRLIRHEKRQQVEISQLSGQIAEVSERFQRFSNKNFYDVSWNENDYNWLALGNSLTLVPAWGRGICSTQPDNDYFGLVKKYYSSNETNKNITAHRYNYSVWERSTIRNNVLDLLDVFLDNKIDLVTIQLGENASDISTYEEDLISLVEYIQNKAPKAKIIIIDDFWSSEKSKIRKSVAKKKNLGFADLSDIQRKQAYQSKAGITCYLPNGKTRTVNKKEETHPGDEGMKIIAERVFEEMKKLQN